MALLDSLTIFENILLPIQEYLLTDSEKKQIVYEKLDTLIMKEDYKSLNKMWKTLTNQLKELCND